MKKKLTAVIIAVFFILSVSASVLAVSGIDFFSFLGYLDSLTPDKYTSYSEYDWSIMTPEQRASAFGFVFDHYHGSIPDYKHSFFSGSNSNQSWLIYMQLTGLDPLSSNPLRLSLLSELEAMGVSDFGLGYYGRDGHSSGKFGDGTVADTLNDEFVDYLKKFPYVPEDPDGSSAYKFDNGYYITWEPLLFPDQHYTNYGVAGTTDVHSGSGYGIRFYLHNESGGIVDFIDHSYELSVICSLCHSGMNPIRDFTITQDGKFYYTRYEWGRPPHSEKVSNTYPLPWVSSYGTPEASEPSGGVPAVGVGDDGSIINFDIDSDGVTYEGNTYNYNPDNSVTIGGNTYNIVVNPSDVNDDFYKQFLDFIINQYLNYNVPESTPFDPTDIISSLKSIFTSLETFRSYTYNQLIEIRNYIINVSNNVAVYGNKIYKAIQSLSFDLTDEELVNYQNKLNAAVNSAFAPVISLRDLVEKALDVYKNSNTSSIDFILKGRIYKIDFSKFFNDDTLLSFRILLAAYIYVSYALNTFRRLPSYISMGGDK